MTDSDIGHVSVIASIDHGSRGTASRELHATLVVLQPNTNLDRAAIDRDSAFTIIAGSGVLTVATESSGTSPTETQLIAGTVAIVHAGSHRMIQAGEAGLTWSSIHRARAPMNP